MYPMTWFSIPPGWVIALRDSATTAKASVSVTHEFVADSNAQAPVTSQVAVTYEYYGYAAPDSAERDRWKWLAQEILSTVRVACVPTAPPAATGCKRLRFFRSERPCGAT